jgi:dienelactone hydrolase
VVAQAGPVEVHDIAYLSGGVRVDGYLVARPGRGRRPGIVLVHGSPGGDRRQLLGAAIALALRGAVAITITEPSAARPRPAPATVSALLSQARAVAVGDVIAVRRAADLLTSLPIVDARRLGYLGWSAGAKTGAFVAAFDRRFKALALLSAGADKLAAYTAAAPAPLRALSNSSSPASTRFATSAGRGRARCCWRTAHATLSCHGARS